ncbi:rho guanine nucleotide exchange factor 4 isoform X1 [Arapaima gigas]
MYQRARSPVALPGRERYGNAQSTDSQSEVTLSAAQRRKKRPLEDPGAAAVQTPRGAPDLHMDMYAEHCRTFSVPVWVASLLHTASRLRSDRARRKKVYKLIKCRLFQHRVGCSGDVQVCPTYVFPAALKELVRTVFPQDVCNYPDPSHAKVIHVTLEDLNAISAK